MRGPIAKTFGVAALVLGLVMTSAPGRVQAEDPTIAGQWGEPISWPSVGVHAMLLSDGKVMTWGHATPPVVYDPASGSVATVPNPFANPVCGGANNLADGRAISIGGGGLSGPGVTSVTAFTAGSSSWSALAPTSYTTWYASSTVLGDGRLLRVGGVNGCNSCNPENAEIYDPATDAWSILSNTTTLLPMYPFTFLRPDGTVAITGASEVTSPLRILDPVAQTWSVSDANVVDGASPAMYDIGKVIKAGAAADSGNAGPAVNTAYITDLTQASPQWTQTGSMQYPRSFLNLTALPDGTVLATGGETTKDGNNPANAVLAAEDWSPSTGTWTTWASEATPRLYHSTAVLLPDGRVFVSGSGDDPGDGVPDNRTSEIFSPPYLFRGARPAIYGAPSQLDYGSTITISTPDAASIASVSLIRTGNTTHFFDQSARRVPLSFTAGGGSLTVTSPASGNIAPPGYYMLFIVNSSGVPSVAPIVHVGSAPAPPPPKPTPLVGTATVQSDLDTDAPGQAEALQYTANATGTVGSLSAYIDAANGAATVYVGLYSDSNGSPGSLLTQGKITNPTAGAWNTMNVAAAQVVSGSKYWLALLGPTGTGTIAFRDRASGGGPTQTSAQVDLSQLPSSWSSGASYSNSPASIYASVVSGPMPSPSPTPKPSPSPTPTPASTPTPTPTPTPFGTTLVGLTAVQPITDSDSPGQSEAFSFTASATGTSTAAWVYLDGSNTAAQVMLGLYADNGGSPAQLLGAATISSPRPGAWNSVPLTVNITSGQRYWLAILQPVDAGGILGFRDGGTADSKSSQTNLATLPAIYSAVQTWASGQLSAYLSA